MSEFVWRLHCIVPAAAVEAAKTAARVLPAGAAEEAMFGTPLDEQMLPASASVADRSPEWVGCSTLLTDVQKDRLLAALEQSGAPARWVLMRADTGEVVSCSRGMEVRTGAAGDWEETARCAREAVEGDRQDGQRERS